MLQRLIRHCEQPVWARMLPIELVRIQFLHPDEGLVIVELPHPEPEDSTASQLWRQIQPSSRRLTAAVTAAVATAVAVAVAGAVGGAVAGAAGGGAAGGGAGGAGGGGGGGGGGAGACFLMMKQRMEMSAGLAVEKDERKRESQARKRIKPFAHRKFTHLALRIDFRISPHQVARLGWRRYRFGQRRTHTHSSESSSGRSFAATQGFHGLTEQSTSMAIGMGIAFVLQAAVFSLEEAGQQKDYEREKMKGMVINTFEDWEKLKKSASVEFRKFPILFVFPSASHRFKFFATGLAKNSAALIVAAFRRMQHRLQSCCQHLDDSWLRFQGLGWYVLTDFNARPKHAGSQLAHQLGRKLTTLFRGLSLVRACASGRTILDRS